MLDYLRKRPMMCAAVGCVLSAVCGYYFSNLLTWLTVIVLAFLIINGFKKNSNAIIVFTVILVMITSVKVALQDIEFSKNLNGKTDEAEFIICSIPDKTDLYYLEEIEIISSSTLKRGTKLSVWTEPNGAEIGEIAVGEIEFSDVEKDFKSRYYSKGIYLEGRITRLRSTGRFDFIGKACEDIRKHIRTTLFRNMSFESAATMCALVFGDRSYFTDEFYCNVRYSGVAHVMVVSGMHLAILVSMVLRILEKYFYDPLLRALIMFCIVILLCGICGFTMSILRASVTYIIMAIGLLLNRPYTAENSLGAAVVFVSLATPFAIFNVGFQLSVLSTFGVIIALPVNELISKRYKMNRLLFTVLSSSIITVFATLLTLPVLIYVFGWISTVSLITNLLISSVVTVCLCVTVAAFLISLVIPLLGEIMLKFVDYGVIYVNFVINYMGSRKYAVLKAPKELAYLSIFLIIGVFYILLSCKKRSDMLKLKQMNTKIKGEVDYKKWQLFLRKH